VEFWLPELSQALLVGFLCGLILSIPAGPLGLTIINHALEHGFLAGFFIGLGGILGETCYAALLLAGHSTILEQPALALALRLVALVAVTALGLRYVCFRPEKLATSAVMASRIEQRWHHPRAFLLGFALTITNLMLIVLWATLSALLVAHEWVGPSLPSRGACVVGVFFGGLTWFSALAYAVTRLHRQLSPRLLTWLVRGCGVALLLLAARLAWRLF